MVAFVGELALNSVLGPWYQQSLKWDQTKSGQVAAAFGLFNVISRPLGGVIADWLYAYVSPQRGTKTKQLWYGFVSRLDGRAICATGLSWTRFVACCSSRCYAHLDRASEPEEPNSASWRCHGVGIVHGRGKRSSCEWRGGYIRCDPGADFLA